MLYCKTKNPVELKHCKTPSSSYRVYNLMKLKPQTQILNFWKWLRHMKTGNSNSSCWKVEQVWEIEDIFPPFLCRLFSYERLGLKGMATKLEWCFKHGGRFNLGRFENMCFWQQQCVGGLGNCRTFPENTVEDNGCFTFSRFPVK